MGSFVTWVPILRGGRAWPLALLGLGLPACAAAPWGALPAPPSLVLGNVGSLPQLMEQPASAEQPSEEGPAPGLGGEAGPTGGPGLAPLGPPAPSLGGGGGGAAAVAASPPPWQRVVGQVVSDGPGGLGMPIEGALVEAFTAWGRSEARSDAAGQFTLNSQGTPSLVSVQADGHLPTAAAHWAGGTLHARLREAQVQREASQVRLSGRVLDPFGQGVVGARVVLQDAWGANFNGTTGQGGAFSGLGVVVGEVAPEGLSCWAWVEDEAGHPAWLGHAMLRPNAQGQVGDVPLVAPVGEVLLDPSEGPEGLESAQVLAVDAQGLSLGLWSWGTVLQGERRARRFDLAGVRLDAQVERLGAGGARSAWRQPVGQERRLQARLLAYPEPVGPLVSGGSVSWAPVPEAVSYTLGATNRLSGVAYWEAHAPQSPLRLPAIALPEAETDLVLTALAGRGSAPLDLLSLAAPSALRWAPGPHRAERWSRRSLAWTAQL